MWRIVSMLLRRPPAQDRAEKGQLILDQQTVSDAVLQQAKETLNHRLNSYDHVKLRR